MIFDFKFRGYREIKLPILIKRSILICSQTQVFDIFTLKSTYTIKLVLNVFNK